MKTYTIEAEIMPMQGVNDPQGESLLAGFRLLGTTNVSKVRVGRHVRFQLEAENAEAALATATSLADKLLVNPVVEEYELSINEE